MIKCAAIRHEGKIYEGDAHASIGLNMLLDGVCKRPYPGGEAQGFVTDKGEFVDRTTARKIAIDCEQVIEGFTCHKIYLFSEDLRKRN